MPCARMPRTFPFPTVSPPYEAVKPWRQGIIATCLGSSESGDQRWNVGGRGSGFMLGNCPSLVAIASAGVEVKLVHVITRRVSMSASSALQCGDRGDQRQCGTDCDSGKPNDARTSPSTMLAPSNSRESPVTPITQHGPDPDHGWARAQSRSRISRSPPRQLRQHTRSAKWTHRRRQPTPASRRDVISQGPRRHQPRRPDTSHRGPLEHHPLLRCCSNPERPPVGALQGQDLIHSAGPRCHACMPSGGNRWGRRHVRPCVSAPAGQLQYPELHEPTVLPAWRKRPPRVASCMHAWLHGRDPTVGACVQRAACRVLGGGSLSPQQVPLPLNGQSAQSWAGRPPAQLVEVRCAGAVGNNGMVRVASLSVTATKKDACPPR